MIRKRNVKLNSGNDERSQRLRFTAARRVVQRDKDVPFLVPSGCCVYARLLCITWPENGFVDVVTRVHGHIMFAECLPMRPGFTVTSRGRFSFSVPLLRWDMELGCYRLGRPVGNGLATSRSLARSRSARFRNSFSAGIGAMDTMNYKS